MLGIINMLLYTFIKNYCEIGKFRMYTFYCWLIQANRAKYFYFIKKLDSKNIKSFYYRDASNQSVYLNIIQIVLLKLYICLVYS